LPGSLFWFILLFMKEESLTSEGSLMNRAAISCEERTDAWNSLEAPGLLTLAPGAFPEALFLVDLTWTVVYSNLAAQELVGRGPENISGQSLQNVLAISNQLWEELLDFASGQRFLVKRRWSKELVVSLMTGVAVPIELRVSWMDPEQIERGFLVWVRDLTEEKRSREELSRMECRLSHAERLAELGKLASRIAHDFNGFLSVILGYASLALTTVPLDPKVVLDLEKIQSAATQAAGLANQVLNFSRKQSPTFAVLPWSESIRVMADLFRSILGPRVTLQISQEAGEICAVSMDAAQVQQMVMNLIKNAKDAMPTGGEIRVKTSERILLPEEAAEICLPPGPYAVLEVSDNGPGLPDVVKSRLFEPYLTTKPSGCGTGLGLSIIKQVVTNHKGGIRVKSLPGQGATFQIYLPRCG
jgi:PAS domain S-box-containing protein